MALQDALEDLKNLDFNELEFENVGSWPIAARVVVWLVVFAGCLGGGYKFLISERLADLESAQVKETDLRGEFERKAFKAANLRQLKQQMLQIEDSFGALLAQLPSDTEVPGLLEDITEKAVYNGLEISSIKLLGERAQEFYIELPISIDVQGSYHDLAGFVSGIAGLSRIVTLHDYSITRAGGRMRMSIQAKTYRYKEVDE